MAMASVFWERGIANAPLEGRFRKSIKLSTAWVYACIHEGVGALHVGV
jgi:hypothetical protein